MTFDTRDDYPVLFALAALGLVIGCSRTAAPTLRGGGGQVPRAKEVHGAGDLVVDHGERLITDDPE